MLHPIQALARWIAAGWFAAGRYLPMSQPKPESVMPMQGHEDPPKTACVTLSPLEGHRLFMLLNELAEGPDPQAKFPGLDELLDKVGDANALALWLRENVAIDLDEREVAKVRELLQNAPPQKTDAPEADAILPTVQSNLPEHPLGGHCVTESN